MDELSGGWSWFGVALLILAAAALLSVFLRRRGRAYPDDHQRIGNAQGGRPLIKAAIAEQRDVIAFRPPLTQNEYEQSEDDMQQERLGPRGVPGEKFPFGMTQQRRKKTPASNDPGHTA